MPVGRRSVPFAKLKEIGYRRFTPLIRLDLPKHIANPTPDHIDRRPPVEGSRSEVPALDAKAGVSTNDCVGHNVVDGGLQGRRPKGQCFFA